MGVFHLNEVDQFCAQFHALPEPGCGIFSCPSCRSAAPLPEAYRQEVRAMVGKIEAMVNEEPVLPGSVFAQMMPSLKIEQINLRFDYMIEALKANPDLSQSPFLQSKVLQDLRDRHIGQLAMAARLNEDPVLSRRLSDYQALIRRVREGRVPGLRYDELPEPASTEQKAHLKAALEGSLYDALIQELSAYH